jgi:hypothetical protein
MLIVLPFHAPHFFLAHDHILHLQALGMKRHATRKDVTIVMDACCMKTNESDETESEKA